MSVQVPILAQNAKRPTANYQPSTWGDQFLNFDEREMISSLVNRQEQAEELKEVVRRQIDMKASNDHDQLKFIDAVQRLGLAYHFEREIEEALLQIFATIHHHQIDEDDLFHTALRFRLLRQQGFHVSCDMFNKFKGDKGSFKEDTTKDVLGMLCLYEAADLRVHGEDILDEAFVFTTTHLQSVLANNINDIINNNPLLVDQITSALNRPLGKSLVRVQARHFISIYQHQLFHNKSLLQLAKLDFNILQSLHKMELSEISLWWKELDVAKNFPFARDRLVELYLWMLGVYFEPQYSLARKILTKVVALASILDDIYDSFGIFEELEIFTEAIERWDVNCMAQLPDYMQIYYQTLLSLFQGFEQVIDKEKGYRIHYTKEKIKILARGYFQEARWCKQGYIPSMDEYLRFSLVTTGYPMLTVASLVGMGDVVTEHDFKWFALNDPKIVKASTVICRLMDDIVSHKFEQEREHVASSVECYMKQYGVASEKEVYEEFKKEVVNAWKDMNQELLRPTAVPRPALERVLNLSRVIDLVYKDDDGYTRVGNVTKQAVASLLIDPLPL